MAIRSNASPGITIALIVFVLLSILLLAGSILLWGRWEEARQAEATAKEELVSLRADREQSAPWYERLEQAHGRDSMLAYLNGQYETLQQFSTGRVDDTYTDVEALRDQLGLSTGESLASAISDANRTKADLQAAKTALQQRVANAEDDRARLDAMLQEATRERDALVAAESEQLQGYTDADAKHSAAIQDAIADFERMQTTSRDQMNATISDQQDEIDQLTSNNKRLAARLRDLEGKINRDRLGAADPATLVDGTVLDVVGSGDLVYIDRGRNDQVVLGMTFEVYDSPAQIKADLDGDEPRGKASIQVVKVGDSSSTAKVTRQVKGRPVLPHNVIANAIYDPEYKFKFLVHGKFDLDGDGRSTDEEAAYLRDRIQRWGGEVVSGTEVPGDLDFLVLGEAPRQPMQPTINQRSTQAMEAYRAMRTAVDRYQSLLDQAQQAKIPVLNQNRLEILTGRSDL